MLSLKTDVSVPAVRKSKKHIFVSIWKATAKKRRIRNPVKGSKDPEI
jgi:hypothetical protein